MPAQIAQLTIPADGLGNPTYVVPDWGRGLLYFLNNNVVRTYAIACQTQSPIRSVALTGITIQAVPSIDAITGDLLIQGGFPGHTMSNTGPVFRLNPTTGAVGNWYGATSTLGSYPAALWVPEWVVGVPCNGYSYAIVKEDAFNGNVDAVRVSSPANHAGFGPVVVSNNRNNRSAGCLGGSSAFIVDSPNPGPTFNAYAVTVAPGAETYDPTTWPTTNPHISSRTVATIADTAIDPTWTSVVSSGIAYDEHDGNLLVSAYGNSSLPTYHLVKINATTGALMWAAPMAAATNSSLPSYNVTQKRAMFLGSGNLYTLHTSDGSVDTTTMAGLSGLSLVMSDDASGLIVLNGSYAAGTGAPVAVTGTPSSFTGWAILMPVPPDFPLTGVVKVLLPPAELQFCDADGNPYAGGTLEFYVQGTSTPKDTWSDPGGTILNTNPLVLDSAGRALIYGDGAYRTVLRDANGNLVWDQPSFTYISACMVPVVGAATLQDARDAMGITDAIEAEAEARAAQVGAEQTRAEAAEANLQTEINNEIARAEAAEAHLQSEISAIPPPVTGPSIKSGAVALDSGGHAHVVFTTPFATACTAVSPTPLESGAYPVHLSVNINDRTSFDVYACYAGTRTVWTGDVCWMATGA